MYTTLSAYLETLFPLPADAEPYAERPFDGKLGQHPEHTTALVECDGEREKMRAVALFQVGPRTICGIFLDPEKCQRFAIFDPIGLRFVSTMASLFTGETSLDTNEPLVAYEYNQGCRLYDKFGGSGDPIFIENGTRLVRYIKRNNPQKEPARATWIHYETASGWMLDPEEDPT